MNNRQKWISFSTIVRREIHRFLRIWPQTLVPPIITIALYFVIFGRLIGSRIGEMSELPYIQFCGAGIDNDVGNYQLLLQCGVVFLRL